MNQNHDQKHKYHRLTTTLHLILKMTTTQVVETSVTNSSLSKDYPHPDHQARQTSIILLHLPTSQVEESDKLKKRKERFGVSTTVAGDSVDVSM